jgi:two-component system, chemotaxis family, chemotaxis protein CheY
MAAARLAALDVLIVDDQDSMRALLTRALARAGLVKVRAAGDAAQALALLAERPADIIVVDQQMPGMDGLAFIAAVRAEPRLSQARIVMLTGHDDRSVADGARVAGADAVLVKPISPRALLETIERVMVGVPSPPAEEKG